MRQQAGKWEGGLILFFRKYDWPRVTCHFRWFSAECSREIAIVHVFAFHTTRAAFPVEEREQERNDEVSELWSGGVSASLRAILRAGCSKVRQQFTSAAHDAVHFSRFKGAVETRF